MYGNPYIGNNNQNDLIKNLDNQISELEKRKLQLSQLQIPQQPITQNFQLAPTGSSLRYSNNIEEVQREYTPYETPFFSKDMSVLWVKKPNGEIKTYELTEIVPKDEKDIQIELLKSEIEELKKGNIEHEQHSTNAISTKDSTNTQRYDESTRKTIKKNKP